MVEIPVFVRIAKLPADPRSTDPSSAMAGSAGTRIMLNASTIVNNVPRIFVFSFFSFRGSSILKYSIIHNNASNVANMLA